MDQLQIILNFLSSYYPSLFDLWHLCLDHYILLLVLLHLYSLGHWYLAHITLVLVFFASFHNFMIYDSSFLCKSSSFIFFIIFSCIFLNLTELVIYPYPALFRTVFFTVFSYNFLFPILVFSFLIRCIFRNCLSEYRGHKEIPLKFSDMQFGSLLPFRLLPTCTFNGFGSHTNVWCWYPLLILFIWILCYYGTNFHKVQIRWKWLQNGCNFKNLFITFHYSKSIKRI